MLLLVAALLGCTPASPDLKDGDTGSDPADADTDVDADTDTDTDTAPLDRDGDGADTSTDCDDTNPDVNPDASETWNGWDDDCDGIIDGDGLWSGPIRVQASAIYEGNRYNFSLTCPFEGPLASGALDFAITCTPDADDEYAQLLLGSTLTITPDAGGGTSDGHWEDDVVFTSSNGWDSDGEGTIDWSSFDDADVEVSMSGVSLAATGQGDISRE